MTLFVILAALMVIAAVAVIARPLLGRTANSDSPSRYAPVASVALASAALVIGVFAIYPAASNWHWKDAEAAAASRAQAADPLIERLEDRVREAPDDLDGWLLLGRAYTSRHRYYRAADAFDRSLELSGGANIEAVLGLGEALAMSDQSTLTGRAGELFDRATALDPTNARALWWDGAAAFQRNDLASARDRWQRFLATQPPAEIAQILRVKIAEIDRQIGSETPAVAVARPGNARVRVKVDLASELKPAEGVLFVLARHPNEAGPPLAVKRLPPGPWPLEVELSTDDAMMPGRTLKADEEVQVVARISRSGAPVAASGDSYGEVRYHVGRDGLVALRIDKKVE